MTLVSASPGSSNGKTSVLESPPDAVRRRLHEGGADGEVVLCTWTDIDRLGAYRPQWIAATRERIWVVPEDPLDPGTISVPLAEVGEFRTVAGVGSGVLTAKLEGTYFDLLRYSNRQAYRFERLAPK